MVATNYGFYFLFFTFNCKLLILYSLSWYSKFLKYIYISLLQYSKYKHTKKININVHVQVGIFIIFIQDDDMILIYLFYNIYYAIVSPIYL